MSKPLFWQRTGATEAYAAQQLRRCAPPCSGKPCRRWQPAQPAADLSPPECGVILVKPSIQVDHLHTGVPQLTAALQAGEVFIHPWMIGELTCGNLRDRRSVHQRMGLFHPRQEGKTHLS